MVKINPFLRAAIIGLFIVMYHVSAAQSQEPYVRIAKIVVDSLQLENYKTFLKEGIKTAVRVEPGVLRMYAVYEKDKPAHITIFETYASKEAYNRHIKTTHFLKYKNGTLPMVKSLELVDVIPIAFEAKTQH
ncbi:MAG TPA: antibiotic biosynthesis monooxygenase [Chitinophagaceae bacterium]|nr:antibiotic biosynthesis monooxygenase [Chitinophagaceae bacterium]